MGFPVGYTELLLPRIFLHLLSLLGFIQRLIYTVFRLMGLTEFLEPNPTPSSSLSAAPLSISPGWASPRDILPVIMFSELNRFGSGSGSDSCAVCLSEFKSDDKIPQLANCQHIYHQSCLDRWMMCYNHMTCPLCRTPLIPDGFQTALSEPNVVSELLEGSI